jgi:hypothetical protein
MTWQSDGVQASLPLDKSGIRKGHLPAFIKKRWRRKSQITVRLVSMSKSLEKCAFKLEGGKA